MKVFISHSAKDVRPARRLRDQLTEAGFEVFVDIVDVVPGDNWAKAVGSALESADLMIVLLTAGAGKSEQLRREVEYALGNPRFKDRLLPVFIGEAASQARDVPWILKHLRHVSIPNGSDFSAVLDHLAEHAR